MNTTRMINLFLSLFVFLGHDSSDVRLLGRGRGFGSHANRCWGEPGSGGTKLFTKTSLRLSREPQLGGPNLCSAAWTYICSAGKDAV